MWTKHCTKKTPTFKMKVIQSNPMKWVSNCIDRAKTTKKSIFFTFSPLPSLLSSLVDRAKFGISHFLLRLPEPKMSENQCQFSYLAQWNMVRIAWPMFWTERTTNPVPIVAHHGIWACLQHNYRQFQCSKYWQMSSKCMKVSPESIYMANRLGKKLPKMAEFLP